MAPTASTLNKTDELKVAIGIDAGKRKAVAIKLSGLLASSYLLYLKTQYYHWNVTGKNFIGMHQLFENQYTALSAAVDEMAERIRALGHFTPGTVNEFIEASSVKDDSKLPQNSDQMVNNLLTANEACGAEARQVLEAAQEANDEATADMMVNRMAYHDKAAWMLRSTLE